MFRYWYIVCYLYVCVLARHDPDNLTPHFDLVQMVHCQECLLGLRHLNQSSVFFVEKDLHPLKKIQAD